MERSLYYRIPRGSRVSAAQFAPVGRLQAVFNDAFTWTCERLAFERNRPGDPEGSASGSTNVRGDEWNALVVVRFLVAASWLLPGKCIRVHDAGDFIRPRCVEIADGAVSIDRDALAEEFAWLVQNEQYDVVAELAADVDDGIRTGRLFARVAARDYVDRPEFASIRGQVDWEHAGLEDLARRTRFPSEDTAVVQEAA